MRPLWMMATSFFVTFVAHAQEPESPPSASEPATSEPARTGVRCSNFGTVGAARFPSRARDLGISEGHVKVRFTLTVDNKIDEVTVLEASDPVFVETAVAMVKELHCVGVGAGRNLKITVPFNFRLKP